MSTDDPTIRVAAPESFFADDVRATCSRCRVDVYLRPTSLAVHVTETICTGCYLQSELRDTARLLITRDTLRELLLYYARTGRQQ